MCTNHNVFVEKSNQFYRFKFRKSQFILKKISTFKKFTASNFAKLYGFHEQYLNRLHLKYTQNAIKDFYT